MKAGVVVADDRRNGNLYRRGESAFPGPVAGADPEGVMKVPSSRITNTTRTGEATVILEQGSGGEPTMVTLRNAVTSVR
jgi:hypothetical protein